jgi:transposase
LIGNLHNTRMFLCTENTDMRRSFDSLCGIVRRTMSLDPLSGYLFIFKNRRANRIKILYWDADGLAMWYKALQRGTFQFPDLKHQSCAGLEIDGITLRLILDGIDLTKIRKRPRYSAGLNVWPTKTEHASIRAQIDEGRNYEQFRSPSG